MSSTTDEQLPLDLQDQETIQAVLAKLDRMRDSAQPTQVEKMILDKLDQISTFLGATQETLPTDRLWSVKQVALYFGCSEDAARRVLRQPGAPRRIKIPSSADTYLPVKYNAEEVRRYATEKRQKRFAK